MTAPEEITVHANGLRFGALAWGASDDPLVLLLHGYPDTAHSWRHVGPVLAAEGKRVVAPFLRGYGPTDLAPDDRYYLSDLVDDVLALHGALGGDDRAAVVGHDWGAVIVWALTARDPNRFARHVCMSVPPPIALLVPFTSVATAPAGLRQLPNSWYFLANQLPMTRRVFEWSVRTLWRTWSPGYDATQDIANVLAALDSPARQRAALRYYRQNLTVGAKALFTTRPGAPVLFLHGEDDGCIRADLGDIYGERFPAGTLLERIEGAGHFLPLEAPDRVAQRILEYLGDAG
jgi:pimeloyl-ACP methyl ester carboxylesterase